MKAVDQALRDFVAIFKQLKLPYAVMGGIAVRAHSIPRVTWDVDALVGIDRLDLAQFFDAVEQQGYTVSETYRRGWVDQVAGMPLIKFRIYYEGGGTDVDVFLAENDFQREILARSREEQTEIGTLMLVTPEDLILLKLMAARPRDLIDVADILFTQGRLDEDYMRRWADRLGIAQNLEDALTHPPTERP
jgi:hypothetical protein